MTTESRITLVPVRLVAEVWPLAKPFIEKVVKREPRCKISIEATPGKLASGHQQLWLLTQENRVVGAFLSELVRGDSGIKVCRLIAAGADDHAAPDMFRHLAVVKAWAAEIGRDCVEIVGRRGWGRALQAHGLREVGTIFSCEVGNGEAHIQPGTDST